MYYRSQLFVPGNRSDRFEKACNAGADLVCIDLEDAVGPAAKDSARNDVFSWLKETQHTHVSLRINPVDTETGQKDITALSEANLNLPFVMVPKVGSLQDIVDLDNKIPAVSGPFFAIIESAKGLVNCSDIFSHARVKLGMYGAVDYASDVNCDLQWSTHLYGRSKLVASANAHDVLLFDTPHIDVHNLEDCEASTRKAKSVGILARSAIHPAQIDSIHRALESSDTEISYAKRVIEAFEASHGNVVLLDGKFIEEPVVKKARRVLQFRQDESRI
ncbi:HpcH/HpaI aldolase/citrate lyase family protein [Hellea balneolensis]|uniref:HpcH/HpaI aldolase/citrate lyase family protein n=1 Tax=Hellea balneolensis TaxID=287478 RepID=UPI0003FA394D|nr:CoA ester lyase [Hellea balneolensis]